MDRDALYRTLIEKVNAENKLLVRTVVLLCDLLMDIYQHTDDYSENDIKGTVAWVKQCVSGLPGANE